MHGLQVNPKPKGRAKAKAGAAQAKAGAAPSATRVTDAWEAAGSPEQHKATWDLQRNNNVVIPGAQYPIR